MADTPEALAEKVRGGISDDTSEDWGQAYDALDALLADRNAWKEQAQANLASRDEWVMKHDALLARLEREQRAADAESEALTLRYQAAEARLAEAESARAAALAMLEQAGAQPPAEVVEVAAGLTLETLGARVVAAEADRDRYIVTLQQIRAHWGGDNPYLAEAIDATLNPRPTSDD
jgi:hypothetical protein